MEGVTDQRAAAKPRIDAVTFACAFLLGSGFTVLFLGYLGLLVF